MPKQCHLYVMRRRLGLLFCLVISSAASFAVNSRTRFPASSFRLSATNNNDSTSSDAAIQSDPSSASKASIYASAVLEKIVTLRDEAREYAESFGLGEFEAETYALFRAIRKTPVPLGLKGQPFVLRHSELAQAHGRNEADLSTRNWFTMKDLEQACRDDFLDAARGSTNSQKPWQISAVSIPRADSFEAARMTYEDVCTALEQGTVIFNAAGAHIPKLAGPSLAACDATSLPCALNLYVTAPKMKTSAPPHTDKQDVIVMQTSGRKSWKVFSIPNPAHKPQADVFARGKMEDSLPLHTLTANKDNLLVETTLHPGDVMFCPAGFPHTTSTVIDNDGDASAKDASLHLTLGLDHHIWELDYLQSRRLALKRQGVVDVALGQTKDSDNPFVGRVNELPLWLLADILAELPLGLLDEDEETEDRIQSISAELERISQQINSVTAGFVNTTTWNETVRRVRQQGIEIYEIHRDMYLAALDEGRLREAERAMTAHLDQTSSSHSMTPERIQRLSLFRVKKYFDKINDSKTALQTWSCSGNAADESILNVVASLPKNWQYTLPIQVGDEVEADLGGAFFPARVTGKSDATYDVRFFDGDKEYGLERSMLKLMNPPSSTLHDGVDTSAMTKKELKKLKKEQDKLLRSK